MPIVKNVRAGNGVMLGYHRVRAIEIDVPADVTSVRIQSYYDESAATGGLPVAWEWQFVIPSASVSGDVSVLIGVEKALTAGGESTFAGGAIVRDMSDTLLASKQRAWAACKAARDAAEAADFVFDGVAYQPDMQKITGAVLAALLPSETPFSIDWTVSDNSVVTLNASQVIGLGLALTARINSIHQYGRTMRALIDNAETPAEAYGHTWDYQNG